MAFNFNDVEEIRNCGFVGFRPMTQLFEDCSVIPREKGVYIILYINNNEPNFSQVGCGGFFKSRDPNVSVEKLKSSWISNSLVVYIGKAGGANSSATLHSRLKQYFTFGQGKAVGHYGGRYIWQLEKPGELVVCWKPTPNEDPRTLEKQLISEFVTQFAKRPFANLTD